MARQKQFREFAPIKKCGGKNIYITEKAAREIAEQEKLIFANSEPELKLDVYKCAFCGGWHLTSRND